MNKKDQRIACCAASVSCVAILMTGCAGHRDHFFGSEVPHTASAYAYGSSIGAGQLASPDAIALNTAGDIFVASYGHPGTPRITEFNPSGNDIFDFGTTGTTTTGLLEGPQGVYVDPSGNSYVSDANSGQIVVFDSTNKFKANLLTGQIGTFPYQINADSKGNLYVASSDLAEVIEFNPSGTLLATFGKTGPANAILNDPDGVATDASGNVYVCDYGNHDIVEYGNSGALVKIFGNTGNYRLQGPQGITVNPTYGIFVADISNSYVYHFDLSGNFIETVGDSSGPGQLFHPYDVTVGPGGELMVVDSGNNRVAVYTLKPVPQTKP